MHVSTGLRVDDVLVLVAAALAHGGHHASVDTVLVSGLVAGR